ncbi:MAG TPA: tRNA (guanosine(46)-N7)-methyltransferase TrmB [Candidatus Avacidaminococcus intestinavium]|uniref:tRNA (guanine-N(7)-)-methyltransferase n=1 Tax=Candidatus Avacidaminococcus intestinavium TaxID=2840684 RepID=A0A9D1MR47_9FIRM|nr:tRNA (guanosine(46)-N7)-methyltransferase TrmB [Candidatus Avacidaminococcus intestinavium]
MRLRKKPWISEAISEYKDDYIYFDKLTERKGKWREVLPFETLALEIGCGKGAFINGLAELQPLVGFIGVESQHDISYYPAKSAKEAERKNVKIICNDAAYLEEWFAPGEIKMIYLNFSDPWPKARHAKRRLTHKNFLAIYRNLLGKGGILKFKTDNRALFDFSLEEFKEFGLQINALSYDLHHSEFENLVQTEYETKFSAKGKPICFCEVIF